MSPMVWEALWRERGQLPIKDWKKPFGQNTYPLEEIQLSTLSGYAYRFLLIIPVLFRGKRVFSREDEWELRRLLTKDFGGCSYTHGVTHPLFQGTYVNVEGNIIENENALYVVYARQTAQTERYFRELQQRLQEYSGEEKILIEMQPVVLLWYQRNVPTLRPTPYNQTDMDLQQKVIQIINEELGEHIEGIRFTGPFEEEDLDVIITLKTEPRDFNERDRCLFWRLDETGYDVGFALIKILPPQKSI